MNDIAVKELFHENIQNCDVEISHSSQKSTLQSILRLFVKVRSFNYAKDLVQKFKLKSSNINSKKALRKTLKSSHEGDFEE